MNEQEIQHRIQALIAPRRDEMISDLARFIAIPTGHNYTPGLDTFRALLIARLEALGAETETVPGDGRPDWLDERGDSGRAAIPARSFSPPPTVICRRPMPGRPRILLAGHIDTVFDPRGPFQVMTVAADGKTAIGPGVVDMKGGILIAIVALEALQKAGIEVSWSFVLNSDEETGSYASGRALRAAALEHDVGLALEPALPDGGLVIERKGSGQFIIEALGRSAHAGRDFDKGISAVYLLAHAVTRVEQLTDLARGITVNIGPLQGGDATNIVPGYAAAWGNVRFPDAASGGEIERRLTELDTAGSGSAPGTVRIRTSFARPAKPRTEGTQRLAELARQTAESLGQKLPFGKSGGVCDGNNLQDAGLSTIDTLGVRGGGLHTHQEWIELDSLTERATLLACLMARLSSLESM